MVIAVAVFFDGARVFFVAVFFEGTCKVAVVMCFYIFGGVSGWSFSKPDFWGSASL